ncbi:unnamed protein product, partial [Ectocarpus fasciculatus]
PAAATADTTLLALHRLPRRAQKPRRVHFFLLPPCVWLSTHDARDHLIAGRGEQHGQLFSLYSRSRAAGSPRRRKTVSEHGRSPSAWQPVAGRRRGRGQREHEDGGRGQPGRGVRQPERSGNPHRGCFPVAPVSAA